ncbi:MAG: hypothetical protein JNN30_05350 [Rhodanobacteraceae bacterium]|nr:hypothetical protein [Rhodanobacteraceae bacterium]
MTSMFPTKNWFQNLLSAAALAALAGSAAAGPERPLLAAGGLAVQPTGAAAVELSALRAGAVAVLDPQLSSSRELLDALHRSGYQGEGLVVLVTGDAGQAEALRRRSAALPQARWVSAAASTVLQRLKLAGTPVVLGLDRQQRVAWRESGLPADPLHLALRIAEWAAVPPAAERR